MRDLNEIVSRFLTAEDVFNEFPVWHYKEVVDDGSGRGIILYYSTFAGEASREEYERHIKVGRNDVYAEIVESEGEYYVALTVAVKFNDKVEDDIADIVKQLEKERKAMADALTAAASHEIAKVMLKDSGFFFMANSKGMNAIRHHSR